MHTLLIDDDSFALRFLARQLRQLGYSSMALCEDAREAVRLLEVHFKTIELIFCDLLMPGFDGIEFIRHLESVNYKGGLVLVSGEDGRIRQMAERLALVHRINLLGALAKPVAKDQLQRLLDQDVLYKGMERRRSGRPAFGPDAISDAIRRSELFNLYQPKVELSSGRVVGVEALVRWRHPTYGIVFPDRFVGVAEQAGLAQDLAGLVMATAFAQAKAWRNEGLSLLMAVNVSVDAVDRFDMPEFVAREVSAAGIQPSDVVLEVTESRLMNNLRGAMAVLTRLRLKRFGLAIDDFGTDSSSLVQLRDVPFNELKLARGFIHGAPKDSRLRAMLEGMLTMARGLGIESVAKGVEDLDEWEMVRAMGCTMAQGYFIARPMIARDLVRWLPRWKMRRPGLVGR